MKEILSSQYDAVSGGWHDQDGTGHRSSSNGGSGSLKSGGNGGGKSFISRSLSSYNHCPYGSGTSAEGIWGTPNSTRNGYSGNGTSPQKRERGGKNH